jgi:hypothetical protein
VSAIRVQNLQLLVGLLRPVIKTILSGLGAHSLSTVPNCRFRSAYHIDFVCLPYQRGGCRKIPQNQRPNFESGTPDIKCSTP